MTTQTATAVTCEAFLDKRQTEWGWEPVQCSQTVGLVPLIDAAGITRRACTRGSHRADVVRRFGETLLPEELVAPDWRMPGEHGKLGLGTPWTRALFPGPMRAATEELIPAGYRIEVTAVDGRPGPWRVRAVSTERLGSDLHPLEVIPWRLTRDPVGLVATFAKDLG